MDAACLVPGCPHLAKSRGLCLKCRAAAKDMCAEGETTASELMALGLMLPATNPRWTRLSTALVRARQAKRSA